MALDLIKGLLKIHMIFAWLMGFLCSYHLMFYPNVGGISVAEDWRTIIIYFCQGLVSQYFLLHFFNEQEQENN